MANPNPSPATRFKPGNRANPGGRRGPKLSSLIMAELDKPSAEGSSVTRAQKVAERLVALAESGDLGAIREVIDRIEGKSIARSENGDPGAFTGLEDAPTADLLRLVKRQA